MKLAVVGSQAIDRRQAEQAWVLIQGLLLLWDPDEVWSGGATGIDSVAEECAKAEGYQYDSPEGKHLIIRRPDVKSWDPIGQRGYKARNIEIVDGVNKLVRVAKREGQKTYGSGWTADYAEEKLGKENVFRYYL